MKLKYCKIGVHSPAHERLFFCTSKVIQLRLGCLAHVCYFSSCLNGDGLFCAGVDNSSTFYPLGSGSGLVRLG